MRRRGRKAWLVALSLGAVLALGLLGQAWAQYPPPVGSLALAARDTTPDLGEEVAITASVLDENGEAAAGVECTFTIAEQPGDDAGVDPGPFTTDADGNVSTTLNTGSAEGAITVEATCGELSALVSVVAGAAAAPPASLPETGSGAQDSTNWAFWALIAAGAVVGVSGLAIAWRLAKA